MSWTAIALSALGGGIGAALGGVLSFAFKDAKAKRAVLVIGSVLGATAGKYAVRPVAEAANADQALRIRAPAAFDETNRQSFIDAMRPIMTDPAFVAWTRRLQSPDAGFAAGAELTAKGIGRLPPTQFNELLAMKAELARDSKYVCSAIWTGKLDSNLFSAEMQRHLSSAEVRRWFELSAEAMRAELQQTGRARHHSMAELAGVLEAVFNSLPESERETFARTFKQGEKASPEDGCKAVQQMLRERDRVPIEHRDRLAAFIVSPASFGD